jgi:pyruvate,water dikinase
VSAASPTPLPFHPRAERVRVLDDSASPASLDAGLVGGKGLRLVQLRSLGAPVPAFVVVTTAAFRETVGTDPVVRGLLARLRDEMGRSDPAALARLQALCGEAAARVRALGCPDTLARELREALVARGLHRRRLAVRSSAIGEDAARHSFAGLLDSELGVDAERLPGAIARVWASAFSPRALAYRSRLGIGLTGLATAVVVQEMVDATVSGVLFTRHPDEPGTVVVSAAPGLGEGVVQGTAECETHRISRSDGGLTSALVPGAPAALAEAELRRLVALGLEVEQALEGPQDVEWALDSCRRLHLLQARPVTLGGSLPARGERRLFENANVVESYPGLTRPLTFSFAAEGYERAFRRAARGIVPFRSPLERRPHLFRNLIALVDGRVYYNLSSWYEIFSCLARPDAHRRSWDRHLGMAHDESLPAPPPASLAVRLQALGGVSLVLLGVRRLGRRFARRFARLQVLFRDPAPAGVTPDALCRTYHALGECAGAFWHLTLFNDLCAMRYQDALGALVRRWLPGREGLAATLLASGGRMESLAPVESLRALAAAIEGEPGALALVQAEDAPSAWAALVGGAASASLRRALLDHVDAFGDRCLEELKLETPSLREEPWRLLALVDRARALDGARSRRDPQADARRQEARRLVAGLALPKRLAIRFVLRRARLALRQRESMRLARARLFGLARTLFRRLGDELWARGVLRRPEDVFDLTTAEVLAFFEGTTVTRDLQALVDLRRREYAVFATRSPAGRLETIGPPSLGVSPPNPGPAEVTPQESSGQRVLRGTACVGGVARGRTRVVVDPAHERPGHGEVLVARTTDPGWVFLMMTAAGLVAERGSPLSHTAIVGRELGIPTVVGVPEATTRLPAGAEVTVDGDRGEVRW